MKKPMIFVPTEEDKIIATETCNKVIDIITKIHRTELRCFIMQELMESFEETHNVDIRGGYSIDIKQQKKLRGSNNGQNK